METKKYIDYIALTNVIAVLAAAITTILTPTVTPTVYLLRQMNHLIYPFPSDGLHTVFYPPSRQCMG